MQTAWLVFAFTLVLFIIKRVVEFRNAVKTIHNHPGTRALLPHLGPLGLLFKKPIKYITRGGFSPWRKKYQDFAECGVDVISSVTILPNVATMFAVADPVAVKEITTQRLRFPKPTHLYAVLKFFGSNIVATEFDEWKRFKKIAAPAFSERNNKLVWDETVLIMQDLFDNVWGGKDEIAVSQVVDEVTLPIALFVIGVAGFGRRISWTDGLTPEPGHKMPFKDALHIVSNGVLSKAIMPNWILEMGLTEHLRNVKIAFDELRSYMVEMVHSRTESEKKEERYDLFSSLLDNTGDEDGTAKLTEDELMGNIFIFLLAGHETTAHTLAFTFGMLALYPEVQEKLYDHIVKVVPDGRIPTYDEMDSLDYALAVLYEILRLFPPVISIPKYAAEDTTLTTSTAAGEPVIVPVPAGSSIVLHVPGLHYNPRYWPDPYTFKPERFLGDWPRDAWLPFSGGARSCLGRRFFETEAIAILVMLISRYKVVLPEEPEFVGESLEEKRERMLRATQGITLTPKNLPLVFRKRKS